MTKRTAPAPKPKFPSVQKRCKYCHLSFDTKPTYNGQQMEFCTPQHRWAFRKEGKKPIAAILKKQEKHMRQIAREEIEKAVEEMMVIAERQGLVAPGTSDTPRAQ